MPVIAPDPVLPYGLAGAGPALPPGAVGFNRVNAWDNPVRYRLNRPYGDEFEYGSFQQLTRKWTMKSAVAADFNFAGGSAIDWKPTSYGSAIYAPAPMGDFEAVLEHTIGYSDGAAIGLMMALVDGTGAGAGGALYQNTLLYTWVLSAWGTSTTGGNVASGFVQSGQHMFLAIRRTGTTLTARISMNGSTFTALTSGSTVSATAPYIAIMRAANQSVGTLTWQGLHRLNIYPGPNFFTG